MELVFTQIVWPFVKKYWSQILNVALLLSFAATVKIYSARIDSIKQSYAEQAQKAQQEHVKELNDLIKSQTENQKKLLEDLDKINQKEQEDIKVLLGDHQKKLEELTAQELAELEKIKKQKDQVVKVKAAEAYNDPDKVAEETAKKFGFKFEKQEIK